MNRSLLVVAALVLAAGAAIYFVVRDDGASEPPATEPSVAAGDRPARDVPQSRVPQTPTRGVAIPAEGEDTDDVVVTQREEGGEVRDHRGAGAEPYVRPGLPHPSQSPVTAEVTAAVMKEVRPAVLRCLQDIPETAYGARPVVMTRARISIDDQGSLTVHELGPAASDIDASAVAPALDCIREQAASIKTRVDHPAVETATLAFPIRPLAYRGK